MTHNPLRGFSMRVNKKNSEESVGLGSTVPVSMKIMLDNVSKKYSISKSYLITQCILLGMPMLIEQLKAEAEGRDKFTELMAEEGILVKSD